MKKRPLILIALLVVSCSKANVKPSQQVNTASCDCKQQSSLPDDNKPIALQDYALLKPASWQDIDGFTEDDLSAAWPAWLQSCSVLKNKTQKNKTQANQQPWQAACAAASVLTKPSKQAVQAYFVEYFDVYSANNSEGANTGLMTGYYQPLLKGSRSKSNQYPYPLYKQPDDLITVDLGETYPDLKNKRVRGKLVTDKDGRNKLVPYPTRAEIETATMPLAGNELVWINDQVEGFFLQVQGSGIVQFDNGETIQVGYADQNGQAYNSIGRVLIERGELTKDQAGMQGIKNWATKNPAKLQELLNANPSYVFFRELPAGLLGPLGALGVPLTAERSVAIDPRHVPLGAPIFLSTTQPNTNQPLKKLMVAQDTGGAIKGGVRADYFWGAGDAAGKQAGSMKQQGKIWVLLPKGFELPK